MARIGLGFLAESAKSSRTARERLFKQIYPMLRHYIRRKVKGETEREDILQDVCVRVASNLGSYSITKGSFAAWMYTIARNIVIDYYRQGGGNEATVEIDDILDETANPLDSALAEETRQEVRSMLKALPPQQKEIIELRYFFGLRNKEIAAALEIEERSVSSALGRGLKKLQAVLSAEERP